MHSIWEGRGITSSPLDKSCLLAYTPCNKTKMLSLPVFAPLLHYAASNSLVSTLILLNDKFNKIYPPRVSCLKLLPLIQIPRRLWFMYWKTTGSMLLWALLRTWAYVDRSERNYSLGGKKCVKLFTAAFWSVPYLLHLEWELMVQLSKSQNYFTLSLWITQLCFFSSVSFFSTGF